MRYFLEMMAVGEGQKAVARDEVGLYHQLFFEECLVTSPQSTKPCRQISDAFPALGEVAQQKDLAF